jgi:ubiquinone/menaquinone biosynthesis C-methylase UbiE
MAGGWSRMSEVWDRVAARRSAGDAAAWDVLSYGPELPSDAELKLTGDVSGKRVLDLGCGAGENAIVLARKGAHVIALDTSNGQLALAKKLADAAEVRVELHESDAADLAFLRADSIDLALAVNVLGEIEDIDRVFRQVHRVLRPGAAFVFSLDHPVALAIGRSDVMPGELPLGALELRRSYFDVGPLEVTREDERIRVYARTMADVFAALHRAGYRVDMLLEPEPVHSANPGPSIPPAVIWRARKVGV